MINFKNKLQGLSLIELLIAITISALLLVGAVSLLVNNKRIYKTQNEMGRMQENTRFAVEKLFDDLRLAAYVGCSNDEFEVRNIVSGVVDNSLGDVGDLKTSGDTTQLTGSFIGIEGSESAANWSPSGGTDLVANIVAGTDAFTVRSLQNTGATIQTPFMNSEADNIFVALPLGNFIVGDVITISDCQRSDIFKVSAITDSDQNTDGDAGTTDDDTRELAHATSGGNVSSNLSKAFNSENTTINRLKTRRYFIGNGTKGNSLFFSALDGDSVELIEGVDDMQIMYGVDSSGDGTPNTYYNAGVANLDSANEWANVVSVRITLTFRILDQGFYDVLNETIPTRSVTTTVQVRNRSLSRS